MRWNSRLKELEKRLRFLEERESARMQYAKHRIEENKYYDNSKGDGSIRVSILPGLEEMFLTRHQ